MHILLREVVFKKGNNETTVNLAFSSERQLNNFYLELKRKVIFL